MSEIESSEVSNKREASGSARCCPNCGGLGSAEGPGEMIHRTGPMPMAKMAPMWMSFMVIVPALLAFGVGIVVGRGAGSR